MRKTTDTQIIRTAIVKAIAKQQPVTISYTSASGRDIVRTVEPYALTQSKAGDTLVKTMDREAGDYRSFRLDRISAYTVHRTYFLIKNPTNAKDVVMAKDNGAPVSGPSFSEALMRVRRGDLVMVELRTPYTVGAISTKTVEELEYQLMTVTNLTRDGQIKMVRDERWSSDSAPVKLDSVLYATGNRWLMLASAWDTAKANELARAHTYPNSDTPRCYPSLDAAREALAPARLTA